MRGYDTPEFAHEWKAWISSSLKLDSVSLFGIFLRCFTMHLLTALEPVFTDVRTYRGRVLGHLLIKLD